MTKKKFDVDALHPYVGRDGKKLFPLQVVAGSVLLPSDQFAWLKTWFDNFCHQNQCPNGIGDWNHFASELSNGVKK